MMPDAHRLLWAKSDRGRDDRRWLPVLAHLLDVGACAWELLGLEPEKTLELYARDLGFATDAAGLEATRRWVCALVALHDLGKASPAFQQQWPEWPAKAQAASLGLSWPTDGTGPCPNPVVPHGVITQVTLPQLMRKHGWHRRAAKGIADAIGAHHGFRASPADQSAAERPKEQGGAAWEQVRAELYGAVCSALEVNGPPDITRFDGGAYMRLAGLTSFADWVGSSFDLGRYEPQHLEDPRAYFGRACKQAQEKLKQIGWEQRTPLASRVQTFAEVFAYLSEGRPFRPRPLQQAAEELLRGVSDPALLLVEAPMGEGKTEVAWYAHLTLQTTLKHRGLYIALPTQATGNAMFTRTAEFLERAGGGRSLDLQLLHGGKDLNQDFQALRVRPNTDAPEEQAANVRAREWFTVRKRALLSEYGVGTVDQALLGVLPVAHQFIRLWGLGNRTVVLDEVHAYDVYTGQLIEQLVRWLHALGSSVVLMSATLPRERRAALLHAYGAQDAPWADYPRLTCVTGGQVQARHVPADPARDRTLSLHGLGERIEDLAERVRTLHAQGGITAVIVNTVQRAQDLRQRLAQAGLPASEVLLFHARYRNKDRRDRERWVLELLGKHGARPERLVLIGTQVLEQSLDYDADVMVTDLAPLDLILQRAGRLHRHDRDPSARAGHARPALHIAGLHPETLPDLQGTAWGHVYQPWTLLRAWAILRQRSTLALPRDLDDLVQAAYQDADPADLPPAARTALEDARLRKVTQDAGGETAALFASIVAPDRFPGEVKLPMWDDDARPDDDPQAEQDGLPRTRLGDESVTVIPLFRHGDRLLLDPQPQADVAPLFRQDFESAPSVFPLVAALHERSVRLGRREVVKGICSHVQHHLPAKPALHWTEIAALRDARPLVFTERQGRWTAQLPNLGVEHDPELGLVFTRPQGGTA
ncbi:CRISPR-associated endonuclease/helicase Cas3 [Deinobacterium chartae]|uniref:CRISPR-associated endonuclease/helicase Cas3 n=1 Tax=Deinobacterium chartae TaxID=521158 RepID=A0A841I3X5_9DEIO|nr:CRISPR-associated helicase Cas3' [Deinobacterium chartae]MBB6100013.1 CRISPR-associated endonuclease/helicase Cas3 [Deinobacterium chartae]